MSNFSRAARAVSVLAVGAALLAPGQASAAGFFEQLFGMTPAPAGPTYDYAPNQRPSDSAIPQPESRPRHPRRVADEGKPVLQKTTDLMHDKTLRAGDAVMTKTGIEIYEGWQAPRHTRDQFAPVDEADLSKTTRKTLLAMDEARRDPLGSTSNAAFVREGRSAAVDATPITTGYRITDAKGRSIRYVGP